MITTNRKGTFIAILNFRRINSLLFYKCVAAISFFVLVFVQSNYSSLKCQQNVVNMTEKHKYNNEEEMVIDSRILALRKRALEENKDEFLEEVLKESNYHEVNLYSKRRRRHQNLNDFDQNVYFDKSIDEFEAGVVKDLGDNGLKATVSPSLKENETSSMAFKKDAFNRVLSEMIALNRSIPDTREKACRDNIYKTKELPTMSVVIIYNNEAFVSILRTVISVINRTPAFLLAEIILVDDFSNHLDLQGKLERYLATRLVTILHKIRLIKLSRREGLIRARMIGAHVAIGEVLLFLDAHCEVNKMWAEPILHRIKEKRTAVVSPVIDNIDPVTLEYCQDRTGYFYVGGFKWDGLFYWIPIPNYEKKRKKSHHSPTNTAVIAGGLFGVNREYFWEIGSYDPGMGIWGGENLEISLRVWQCGGSVEIVPCSRVGHMFRDSRPYDFVKSEKIADGVSQVDWNTARVAEVWMDEYKDVYYLHNPEMKGMDFGDVSKRKEWRKQKNCSKFESYLNKVYREKFKSYRDSREYGQVRNPGTNLCLDDMQNNDQGPYTLQLYPCHETLLPSQLFFFSKNDQLRKESVCAAIATGFTPKRIEDEQGVITDRFGIAIKNSVIMIECDENDSVKLDIWEYRKKQNGRIVHIPSGKCLTVKSETNNVNLAVLEKCKFNLDSRTDNKMKSDNQSWEFSHYNSPKKTIQSENKNHLG